MNLNDFPLVCTHRNQPTHAGTDHLPHSTRQAREVWGSLRGEGGSDRPHQGLSDESAGGAFKPEWDYAPKAPP